MFNSQDPHGSVESSIIAVAGDQKTDPLSLKELHVHGALIYCSSSKHSHNRKANTSFKKLFIF